MSIIERNNSIARLQEEDVLDALRPCGESAPEALRRLQKRFTLIPNPGYGAIQYDLPADYVYPEIRTLFDRDRNEFATFLEYIDFISVSDAMNEIPNKRTNAIFPFWDNNFFGRGDAPLLCSVLAKLNPDLMIEIGVGNSTKFARWAIETFELRTRVESIDPSPRANIDGITDLHIANNLLDIELSYFDKLESGSVLFFDGSHVALNGTDVTHLILNVLPRLRSGVLLHVHDIFLPWEYPMQFRVRQFNEQHMLAAMLLVSHTWRVCFPAYYAYRTGLTPHLGGSIWLRRE